MKKNLWALLMAILLLAGCGTPEPTEPTEPPLIEVEVPYETQAVSLMYEGVQLTLQSMWPQQDPQARILTEAATLFEKQTGAEVTIRWQSEETDENTADADIFKVSAADFSALPAEYAMDLTEMARAAEYDQKSHETLRQQVVDQMGYLGAVAQVPYLGGVYYNAAVFETCGVEQMPATWEDFLALCQALREGGWEPLTLDQSALLRTAEYQVARIQRIREKIATMKEKDVQIAVSHMPLTRDSFFTSRAWATSDIFTMKRVSLTLSGGYCAGQWRIPGMGAIWVPELGFFPPDEQLTGLNYLSGMWQHISPGLSASPDYPWFMPMRLFNAPGATMLGLTSTAY